MTGHDLAVLVRADQTPDRAHRLWLRWMYEAGKFNELDLTDEGGERVPDPIAIRRRRLRALLARAPVRAEVGR